MRRVSLLLWVVAFLLVAASGWAETPSLPNISLQIGGKSEPARAQTVIQLLAVLTVLSLAPAILLMLTSFTRIIVVLSLLRHAMGTQQMPPNQILVGLAMFLTFFVMMPIWQTVNSEALQPYTDGRISGEEAIELAATPLKQFMLKQTREKDLALFVRISNGTRPEKPQDVSLLTLIPAFMISELKTAFQIGFLIFLPFLIIDIVVASILLAMGMMMLPPIMISLPFKLLLFVLADGWFLVVESLVRSVT